MKIIFFTEYYQKYLDFFYAKNPGFSGLPYDEQYRRIVSDYFGVPGSYCNYARDLGNDATLIIANCEPMQKQWAAENDFHYDEDQWKMQIVRQQVKQLKPDVFFLGSIFSYFGSFLQEISEDCKKIVTWISCPYPANLDLSNISLILTSSPIYRDKFRKMGINCELLFPAFDKTVLDQFSQTARTLPFIFIGSITPAHAIRYRLVNGLVKKTPLEIWGVYRNRVGLLSRIKTALTGPSIDSRYKGEIFGMEMYALLNKAKIVFNNHIDFAGEYAGNMRMFEATGMGTLLFTDKKDNITDFFEPGKEAVVYDSVDDAIEKATYYLSHEAERENIAKAGQKRTLEEHNFVNSTNQLMEFFEKC